MIKRRLRRYSKIQEENPMGHFYLGVEFGSTRIKAVGIDDTMAPVVTGDFTWKSSNINGIWTYDLADVWKGIKEALAPFAGKDVDAMGISGMMHGYLAFDKDWNLLTPFRTWQNTITAQAADELTNLFGFNVPQRWSICHLYQAMLNGEEHVKDVAHITTLAGYVHHSLTGQNVMGIGEASGMFPIDSEINDYNQRMADQLDALFAEKGYSIKTREVLPKVLVAGQNAGYLTEEGAALTGGILKAGIPFAPCEGDAGTGMTATNSVAPRTGNVSAGTSIFSMVVLERPLSKVYIEIDMVTTPSGAPVAMVHCNNCTTDMNQWVNVLKETVELFGGSVSMGDLYTKLYQKSLEGDVDCGDVTVYNYMAGEGVTHLDAGRPMVVRNASSAFTLANFLRSQLYSTMATLKIGMDILAEENVVIDSLTGHGGLFKTPVVGQSYMAAACNAPVTCMETAGEGGPYGMALLAAYLMNNEESLGDFLKNQVFASAKAVTMEPDPACVAGFNKYLALYKSGLAVEKAAVECM